MATPENNLRALSSSFIGRHSVLEQLGAQLDAHRLVAIVGPPGAGKTRVANDFGRQLLSDEASRWRGVWRCDLGATQTERDLTSDLRNMLHAASPSWLDEAQGPLTSTLEQLGRSLLILDNVEQIEGIEETVLRWLQAAPELRVLLTTRVRPADAGACCFDLGPMTLPDTPEARVSAR